MTCAGAVVRLEIEGEEGFRLEGKSSMSEISRDPTELVAQTIGKNHQYPDGFALFLGTLFAPVQDRGAQGLGFTHKVNDVVRVSSERLGVLENKVTTCDAAPPWTFGVTELMQNLAGRGLLSGRTRAMSDTATLSHYIDGQWVSGKGTLESLNPSNTRDVVARAPNDDGSAIAAAVSAAKAAYPAWANASPEFRSDILDRVGTTLLARKEKLGRAALARRGQDAPRRHRRSRARRAHLQVLRRRSAAPSRCHRGFDATRR